MNQKVILFFGGHILQLPLLALVVILSSLTASSMLIIKSSLVFLFSLIWRFTIAGILWWTYIFLCQFNTQFTKELQQHIENVVMIFSDTRMLFLTLIMSGGYAEKDFTTFDQVGTTLNSFVINGFHFTNNGFFTFILKHFWYNNFFWRFL